VHSPLLYMQNKRYSIDSDEININ